MLEKIKHKLFGLKRAAGVEAIYMADGKVVYNLIILSLVKGVVAVEKTESNVEDLEKLKISIGVETPIALTINGKGVLHKRVIESPSSNDSNLISQVLPNAKDSDFYLQKVSSGKNLFLSVIRKDTFARVRDLFKANQLDVIHVALGPFIISGIIPFIKNVSEEVKFSGFRLILKNNFIDDFKFEQENKDCIYQLGEDNLAAASLTAYASAFNLFIENIEKPVLEVEEIRNDAEEFYNKTVFKIAGYSVLGFFVALMLLNYLLYNYFQSENNELLGKSNTYEKMVKDITQLEEKVEEKEYFLKRAGWLNIPMTSFYADQIASTIPSSIRLSELKINPLNDKQSKKERKQIFQADTIYISGSCTNPTVLNPWMKELKAKNWVQEANNVNYVHDHKARSGNFEVEIMVGDEF